MKIFFVVLLGCIGFTSFGQEKPVLTLEFEELDVKLAKDISNYTITYREIIPSLSFITQTIATGNYYLMEINLSVDLRKQHLKNDSPILLLPENKFVQSEYAIAIPTATKNNNNARITLTGSGGYNNTNNGGIKNNAYRDASTYAVIYCPVTGVPLTY